jgi:hypothetical protein
MATYVYKTTDFGVTWKSIVSNDIVGFARNIQEDYQNENLLFLGTEFGLYITIDGGKSWLKFTNNMPSVSVHFIDLHKKTNDLVLGTHGRGIIIIDDISPIRQLNEQTLTKDLHFFTSRVATMPESNGFGSTATETQFVGENASRAAKIVYYLKKRHTIGKMTVEIQDQAGNKVVELDAKKSKGINVLEWNYRTKPPKIATAKTMSFSGFTPPRVPAGTYKVVIQKGKETYTNDIVIQYDPTSSIPLADRKQNEEVTKKLFNLTQELAYMVYELDETLKAAEDLKAKNPGAAKSVNPLINELTALKKTLVITEGDNYVGMGEPQIREDLAELYAKVASTFFKASKAETDNLEGIESRFSTAKTDFKKIKDKHLAKFSEVRTKNKLEPIIVKSFEEFIQTP